MRDINIKLSELNSTLLRIGFVGENVYRRILIDCKEMFDQYPDVSPAISVKSPNGETYPVVTVRDGGKVIGL